MILIFTVVSPRFPQCKTPADSTYMFCFGILSFKSEWEIEMETYATVKGQVVIPAALRKKYGIRPGTKFHVYDEDGRIVMQPITREYIQLVRGSLKGSGAMKILMDERKRDRES